PASFMTTPFKEMPLTRRETSASPWRFPSRIRRCLRGHDGQKAGLPNRETGLNNGHSGMTGIHSGSSQANSVLVKD
ncbi:MAG: hypothetical protein OXD44_03545, partial [Gammaproteobacteria bacterium]|nr:hypothetical protein [Gammaproteobacteria bacterium]